MVPAAPGGYSARPIDYALDDDGLAEGTRYWYALEEIDLDSSVHHYGQFDIVTLQSYAALPSGRHVDLAQNFPNPFNPRTTIEFAVAEQSPVHLGVYDLTGNLIRKLVDDERSAGTHRVVWDGRNDWGANVPSGVYLYRVETDQAAEARRMVLVK